MSRRTVTTLGTLVLACCLTIALTLGAAEAKKKGKKKGPKRVTVSKTTPTPIPAGAPGAASLTQVPLNVPKSAKGKVVGPDSVALTIQTSAPAAGNLGHLDIRLSAPNGRTVGLVDPGFGNGYPDDHTATLIGPLTLTANSPRQACVPIVTPPPPPCADPMDSLMPPYAGSVGLLPLVNFVGLGARGTWMVRVTNFSTAETFSLDSVKLEVPLKPAPK